MATGVGVSFSCRNANVVPPEAESALTVDYVARQGLLHIEGTLTGTQFRLPLAKYTQGWNVSPGISQVGASEFVLKGCERGCRVSYDVAIHVALQERASRMNLYGDSKSFIAAGSTFLPAPFYPRDRKMRISVSHAAYSSLPTNGLYESVVYEAGFVAFGDCAVRVLSDSVVRVFMGDFAQERRETVDSWIRDTHKEVDRFYASSLPEKVPVFVVTIPRADEVVFGRVLSRGGLSVLLLMGEETKAAGLREDWVLPHELTHLGFPSVPNDAAWLSEGLATYYDPIIRRRLGRLSKEEVVSHFWSSLPKGQGRDALRGESFTAIYWTGALYAFACDVLLRAAHRPGLDAVLRAYAQEGNVTTSWRALSDVLSALDRVSGTDIFTTLFHKHIVARELFPLDELWRLAGVLNPRELHCDENTIACAMF